LFINALRGQNGRIAFVCHSEFFLNTHRIILLS
jgi:hypothetical protein